MSLPVKSAPRPSPARRSRWRRLCFVLAALSLLAAGIGLGLGQFQSELYLAIMLTTIGMAFCGYKWFACIAPVAASEAPQQPEESLAVREAPPPADTKEEIESAHHARLSAFRAEVNDALSHDQSIPTLLQSCAVAMQRHLDAAVARIWTLDLTLVQLELQASAGADTRLDGPHSRVAIDRKSTRLNSSHIPLSRMPSSA